MATINDIYVAYQAGACQSHRTSAQSLADPGCRIGCFDGGAGQNGDT